MALFAMAVPIAPGKMAHFENFIAQLNGERREEYVANRKKLGVHERSFHQHTPMGEIVIVTMEGEDPAGAFAKFAQGDDAFTKWFIGEVKAIHGIDLTQPPSGGTPHLMVDSGA